LKKRLLWNTQDQESFLGWEVGGLVPARGRKKTGE